MGYTHYYTFKRSSTKTAEQAENALQQAVKDCTKILKTLKRRGLRLSGYSANSAKQYGGLNVNGAGDESHETFIVLEHFSQNVAHGFNFCKTARKPYDQAIVACLAVLKWRLGECIDVSSDGDAKDWSHGVELAREILRRKSIQNPMGKNVSNVKLKAA
jgi:hypothetical protein